MIGLAGKTKQKSGGQSWVSTRSTPNLVFFSPLVVHEQRVMPGVGQHRAATPVAVGRISIDELF